MEDESELESLDRLLLRLDRLDRSLESLDDESLERLLSELDRLDCQEDCRELDEELSRLDEALLRLLLDDEREEQLD